MSEHTPGEWYPVIGMTVGIDDRLIASCDCELGVYAGQAVTEAEKRANMHLLAAAPELLEALRELLQFIEYMLRCHDNADATDQLRAMAAKARAALAKALATQGRDTDV